MKGRIYPEHKPLDIEPPRDGENAEDLAFQSIKEHRDNYFVEYRPAQSDSYFASLSMVFLKDTEISYIAKRMEQECSMWLHRYPVPLMLTAFNETDRVLHLKRERACDYLTGIMENGQVVYHWKMLKNKDFPSGPLQVSYLLSVYHDIAFSTGEERRQKAISSAKCLKRGKFIITMRNPMKSIFVTLFGVVSPLFGLIVTAYSIAKDVLRPLKGLGYIKRSDREKKKEAEELRMRHHHYHCEQNPEGFTRLKLENFEQEAREQTRKEHEDLNNW